MRPDPMFAARLWDRYHISVRHDTDDLRLTAADYRDACITFDWDDPGGPEVLRDFAFRMECAADLIEWELGNRR